MKEFPSIQIWNKEAPRAGREEAALYRRRASDRLAGAGAEWRSRSPASAEWRSRSPEAVAASAEKGPREAEGGEAARERGRAS